MARPRACETTTSTCPNHWDDLLLLSPKVLRLHLRALNLPITGNPATLLSSLCCALDGRSVTTAASAWRINKRQRHGALSQPQANRVIREVSNANAPPVHASRDNLAAGETKGESVYTNEGTLTDAGSLPDDLLKDQTSSTKQCLLRGANVCRAQFKRPYCNDACNHSTSAILCLPTAALSYRAPGVATPLGLNHSFFGQEFR